VVQQQIARWSNADIVIYVGCGERANELVDVLESFPKRAGRVQTHGAGSGSVTLIGAVSPPDGDFSEPVTSHTKDIIETFWALFEELADARHYPSIDWVTSFSGHVHTAAQWWAKEVDRNWESRRAQALALLARDAELSRIVDLVGPEALSSAQRNGQVIRTSDAQVLILVFEGTDDLDLESTWVRYLDQPVEVALSPAILGRIFDGLGQPRDDRPPILSSIRRAVGGSPINPAARTYPREFIQTGISTIDGLKIPWCAARSCRSSPAPDSPTTGMDPSP